MKKLIIILTAVMSFNAATAQNRNGGYNNGNDRHQQTQVQSNRDNNGRGQWDDRTYNNNRRNDQYGRNDQYNRQAGYDRMNREYDQQVTVYRNDRSLSQYERQRRINEVERQRQEKAKSFGKGLVVGGLAAILIGVLAAK